LIDGFVTEGLAIHSSLKELWKINPPRIECTERTTWVTITVTVTVDVFSANPLEYTASKLGQIFERTQGQELFSEVALCPGLAAFPPWTY
jgi:hypothetical protein